LVSIGQSGKKTVLLISILKILIQKLVFEKILKLPKPTLHNAREHDLNIFEINFPFPFRFPGSVDTTSAAGSPAMFGPLNKQRII
jgi:hypothetical protein